MIRSATVALLSALVLASACGAGPAVPPAPPGPVAVQERVVKRTYDSAVLLYESIGALDPDQRTPSDRIMDASAIEKLGAAGP